MKSDLYKNRHYLECDCLDPDCFLCFDLDWEDEPDLITVSFRYNKYGTFFQRIKYAFNYVFKKEDLYFKDVVIHDFQLEEFLNKIKTYQKELKENENEK